MRFNVTYDVVTPESAEQGDIAELGFISRGVELRQALRDLFETRTSLCDGVISIEHCETGSGSVVTVYNGTEFETGAHESRALHIPETVTTASRRRIARLAGATCH